MLFVFDTIGRLGAVTLVGLSEEPLSPLAPAPYALRAVGQAWLCRLMI